MTHAEPLSIYLPTKINNVQVNFIVDTGAQSTSITEEVAQATSISRVLNNSVKTEVHGVGTSMTVGFVHSSDVCIQGEYFPLQCQVMPTASMNGVCLLGLDFLKEYHAVIDLVQNKLTLELNGKKIEVDFVYGNVVVMEWLDV